eukprot:TRINITY_DN8772_c0_g1_i1.p1 TRINITY_DN8772_c0_g1~~TRINITY_DN8772_c0_g1_i1.p1  ORF type:complete len:402 (-),score=54.21 TRINITY_DN8772_c0_g1_i1:34-1239(-)
MSQVDIFGDSCSDVRNLILNLLLKAGNMNGIDPLNLPPKLVIVFKTWYGMQLTCKKWRDLTIHFINRYGGKQSIPMLICIHYNLYQSLAFLLSLKCADPNEKDCKLLKLCMDLKKRECFDVFINNRDPIPRFHRPKDFLMKAMYSEDLHIVEQMKKFIDKFYPSCGLDNITCLKLSIMQGFREYEYGNRLVSFWYERAGEVSDKYLIEGCYFLACGRGNEELLRKLKENPHFDPKMNNCSALSVAAKRGRMRIFDILVNEFHLDPSSDNVRCLEVAINANFTDLALRIFNDPRIDLSKCDMLYFRLIRNIPLLRKYMEHPTVKVVSIHPYGTQNEVNEQRYRRLPKEMTKFMRQEDIVWFLEHPKVEFNDHHWLYTQMVLHFVYCPKKLQDFLKEKVRQHT